ncbi:sensor histidine kinase [Polaribacter batillariae]|uniref:Sensor histidine kinase n=1 Tax=Polaribacter batillariae TaxID=2808900 RepID=A0ABX7SUL2_9FLAO|nr:histidine kinase [Polaribacter batillariae]QTD37035.1 sensor histidine kinase [Polaribacter batillariae]
MKPRKLFNITLRHHVIFWFIYFLFNTFRWGRYFNDFMYSFKTNLIGFPIHIFLAYLNIYYLMPKFVFKRKYKTYILLVIIALLAMVFLKFNLTYYLISNDVWPEGPKQINRFTMDYAIDMMIGELYVVTFVTAIKITMDWIKEHKRLMDLEKVQLETELLFLRSQVSPHFFFNTLNNIYSLAIEKSEKTPKIILKLSELMRYILYETSNKRQSLEKEILCIQNYIELERMRHGELLEVNMDMIGDIRGKKIAPILLLSFVENAFKHGIDKNITKVSLDIRFKVEKNLLYFKIANPTPAVSTYQKNKIIPNFGGIGLTNVKKRLELGYRKEDYDLSIKTKNNLFIVKLKIKV